MSALDAVLQRHLSGVPLAEALNDALGAALSETPGDDPQLAALTQLMAMRTPAEDGPDELEIEGEAEVVDLPVGSDPLALVHDQLAEITADVARLQDTVDSLAAALGACPVCLGVDRRCPLCRGRGVPGSLPPEPAAFDAIVLPAVRARAYERNRRLRPESPGRSTMSERSAR